MQKTYIEPEYRARPDVKVPAPGFSPFVKFVVFCLGRIYLFLFIGVARIALRGEEHLYDGYRRALAGDTRLILAFRHPCGGEPQILMYFILYLMRRRARRAGFTFPIAPRVIFIYGYEVVRWGGAVARWVMPNLGALPVHHAKLDRVGMNRIFSAMTDGPYPIAIAPEGQVSYNTDYVPRLEQGTARIGFQAAERLAKAGKDIPVEILPVSLHFRYGRMGKGSLRRLLRKIEKYTGFKNAGEKVSERLRRSRDYILAQNEKRYGIVPAESQTFEERVDSLMEAALVRAEQILGITKITDDIIDRVYHIRQICWDRRILPGIESLGDFTLFERAQLDLAAGEAWHASRHMELVDFVWYFRIPIPADDAPFYNIIEYAQNLWDFANRSMGGAYSNRVFNVHPKRVLIQCAPTINLTERLAEFREKKKEAVSRAMDDLRTAFLKCIKDAEEYQI